MSDYVIFYDVIHLQSVRRDSNVNIEGHFCRFLGKFDPLNAVMLSLGLGLKATLLGLGLAVERPWP